MQSGSFRRGPGRQALPEGGPRWPGDPSILAARILCNINKPSGLKRLIGPRRRFRGRDWHGSCFCCWRRDISRHAGTPSYPPPGQSKGQDVQKLYTTETLAELLQVSPRTIRRERKEGRLPFVRVRGQIRYRETDVRAYLEHNASLSESGSLSHANWGER